jgi:signal transduction histidine kinase
MGLAISRSIIEQYQGHIWGENRPSGGAAVTFSMPPWKPHEADRGQEIHCVCG